MSCFECFCKDKDSESTLEVQSTKNLYAFERKKITSFYLEGKKDKLKQYRTSLRKSGGGQQNEGQEGRMIHSKESNSNVRPVFTNNQNIVSIEPQIKRVQQQITFIPPPQMSVINNASFPQHVHEISLQPQHPSSRVVQPNYYSYKMPKKEVTSTNFSHVVRIPSMDQQPQHQRKPHVGPASKFMPIIGSTAPQLNKTQTFPLQSTNKQPDNNKYEVVLLSMDQGKSTPQKPTQSHEAKEDLLKPVDHLDMFSSRISRTSGVRNIEDIACTKTQSIGSQSSSEFSDVVFSGLPIKEKQIKLTNSSINFHHEQEKMLHPTTQSLISSRRKSQNKKPVSSFK